MGQVWRRFNPGRARGIEKPGLSLAAILAAGVFVAGPASADLPPPPQTSAVPIPDGQVAAAIESLDALVEDVQARSGVPGIALAVVSGGEVVHSRGFGVREIGMPEPVDADTVFQLASVSKSVSMTVVATQVNAELVSWDGQMAVLMPWFELRDPGASAMLTIGDLFSHRSGLPEHAGDDLEDLGYGTREVLERLRLLPLDSFRDSYHYTNFGLTAAATAVAEAAGRDWSTLAEETIYEPLGMTRTSSRFADYIARDNRAVPHVPSDGTWAALHQRQPDAQSPAGGVSSSASDMARWLQMVLQDGSFEGEQIIAPHVLLPALSPQATSAPPFAPDARAGFYGFGVTIDVSPAGRVQIGHSGAFALGAATNFTLLPSVGVGIVILSNAAPVGAVEAIALSFMDLVQFGDVTRDWFALIEPAMAPLMAPVGIPVGDEPPANATPSRALETYAGQYANDYFGPLEVTLSGDGLSLTAGPADMVWELRHWNGDDFVFDASGENAPAGSRSLVSFSVDADSAGAVTVELWDEHSLGTFERAD